MSQPDNQPEETPPPAFMFAPAEVPDDETREFFGRVWDLTVATTEIRWADITVDAQTMFIQGYLMTIYQPMARLVYATDQLNQSIRARMN